MLRKPTLWMGFRPGSTRLLLLGICVFSVVSAAAQLVSAERDFVVEGWQADAGLPHNAVLCIEQTRDGYLWLGTSNGLARFDGVRFSTFRSTDYPGLKDNRILCLYQDHQGRLWAGTEQAGLAWYQNGQFTPVGAVDGLSEGTILCIGEGRTGELWVGTPSGLNRSSEGRPGAFFRSEPSPNSAVYSIHQPQRAAVMFATGNGLFQRQQGRVEPYAAPGFDQIRTNVFLCAHQDFERRLWAGGPFGLVCLDKSGGTVWLHASEIGGASVVRMLEASNGQIWFGTSAGHLCLATLAGGSLETRIVCRMPSPVSALLEDNEKNLWVGTAGSGLYRVKPRQLSWIPFPGADVSDTPSSCVFETGDAEILLLAENRDLYRCTASGFDLISRLPLPGGVVVQTVCATHSDELWLGTRSDGLLQCRGNKVRQFSEREGISDSEITVLAPASDSGLWIGTRNGGLNLLSRGKVRRFNTPWGFSGAYACVLETDHDGSLWIGTTGDGLFRLRDGDFTAYKLTNGPSAGNVGALYADGDGALWVGTLSGLCRLKDGRISTFPGANPFGEEAIVQLRGDGEGNLWTGSSSGIYRFRKNQLNDYADGVARFLDVIPYGRDDGLPAIQCLPGLLSQGQSDNKAGLLFAAAKGLVIGHHSPIRLNTDPPPVLIESVLIENEPVQVSEPIRVPPGKTSIQFQFTALSLTAPGKVAFRYLLEGCDADWSEVSASRSARYPKVTPGKYTFRVVARNNDGTWNESGASVGLVVAPFWWETYWFKLGLLTLFGASVAGMYRLRQERLRELERLRVRIASDLHDDVGSSLWSINLLSRMLAKHGTLSLEEKQDLEEINRIAVQTSNSIRDIIWLINPAFNSMQELLLRVKDFASTSLRGITCHFHSEGVDLTRKLPQNLRQNILFLFKETLTNVAKHSAASEVEVLLQESRESWTFTIRDNGVGFDTTAIAAGSGLKNMRARAARIGATLDVSSGPGQGTKVVFKALKSGTGLLFPRSGADVPAPKRGEKEGA